jgi:hypothetical protein
MPLYFDFGMEGKTIAVLDPPQPEAVRTYAGLILVRWLPHPFSQAT